MSSLTNYMDTWERGACRHTETATKKIPLETEYTHTSSWAFIKKGHDNCVQEITQLKN